MQPLPTSSSLTKNCRILFSFARHVLSATVVLSFEADSSEHESNASDSAAWPLAAVLDKWTLTPLGDVTCAHSDQESPLLTRTLFPKHCLHFGNGKAG